MVGLPIFLIFKLPTIRFYGGLKKSLDCGHAVRLSSSYQFSDIPTPKGSEPCVSVISCQDSRLRQTANVGFKLRISQNRK